MIIVTQQKIPSPMASELFMILILLHVSVNILQEQTATKLRRNTHYLLALIWQNRYLELLYRFSQNL